MLRRAGRRKDSRAHLESARDLFQRLGTPLHKREADAELATIGGRRRETDELTPDERRVAVLVASGKTNREVATALFTSVRTVESHLGRIYRKLNIRSRTELAARKPA